ncbi:MAG: helix-turn-helix domain-containing protein [Dysgonomonas sp.]
MYQEYLPHPSLAQYIEVYWMSNGFVESEMTQRILPDGCVDIIISLGENKKSEMKLFTPYIVGTMTTFLDVEYMGDVRMLGIRFCPGGIAALTPTPIYEFTNTRIDILSFDSILDEYFYSKMNDLISIQDFLTHLNCYFYQKFLVGLEIDERINYAISLIKQENGNLPISFISSQTCLSERQFERRFKSAIGISAKMFSRIIRFNHTRHYLKSTTDNLTETALSCGYTDHSHLIRDFKQLSGALPIDR